MRIQLMRMLAGALADPSTGLAAQLAVLPLDGADVRPAPPALILDPASSDAAVTQSGVSGTPFVLLAIDDGSATTMSAGGVPLRLDAPSCRVRMSVAPSDAAAPSQGWRDASYLLHAALRAVVAGLLRPGAEDSRVRGALTVVKLNGATMEPAVGSLPPTGASLVLDLHCRFAP